MFERPKSGERAVLVHLNLDPATGKDLLQEFTELALAAGAEILATVNGSRRVPEAHFFIGQGKAEEVRAAVSATRADLVLVNHALSPSQERNLEKFLQCRVLDRTGLILDIFAQRARSFEGKLQVELAQHRHLATRLVRGWTHLERQRGGSIGLRGPGETQLETDRRLIGKRIQQLVKRLQGVREQHEQGRRTRVRRGVPTISLVGYTNAGKSTLFNALTGADTLVADQLFATLDTTVRRLQLDNGPQAVLADTVGFIRDLPHDLVAAFRSTLQETEDAALLLHVVDANDPQRNVYIDTVNQVLAEIGAQAIPQLEVFNKIDMSGQLPALERGPDGLPRRIWLSAGSGSGLELLGPAIAERLRSETVQGWLRLEPAHSRARAALFQLGAVRSEKLGQDGSYLLEVELPRSDYQRFCHREGLVPSLPGA
ncbi:MAG: GTPase HflX [Gammaproteobacteria bacterium]|nr:GTPase HflX [Gammaproteobacteria bacterium]MDE2345917.1 GTPase HflX [Gammaproteobacteria bacterium]